MNETLPLCEDSTPKPPKPHLAVEMFDLYERVISHGKFNSDEMHAGKSLFLVLKSRLETGD